MNILILTFLSLQAVYNKNEDFFLFGSVLDATMIDKKYSKEKDYNHFHCLHLIQIGKSPDVWTPPHPFWTQGVSQGSSSLKKPPKTSLFVQTLMAESSRLTDKPISFEMSLGNAGNTGPFSKYFLS